MRGTWHLERGIRYRLIPEFDLVNEIHATLIRLNADADVVHVKGHRDNAVDVDNLPENARLNIDCDHRAGAFLSDPPMGMNPRSSAPFIPVRWEISSLM